MEFSSGFIKKSPKQTLATTLLHFYSTLSHTTFTNGKLCNNIKLELVYKFLQKNRKSLNFIQFIKDVLVMSTTKKKLEYTEIEESSELTTEQQESSERSSTLLLEIMRESYYKEMERTNILDNKTGVFISALIAVITIFMPIIPFDNLITLYKDGAKYQIVGVTCALCGLVVAFILLGIAFFNLYKAISPKSFERVNILNVNKVSKQGTDIRKIEQELIEHYFDICSGNTESNNKKAEKFSLGLKLCMISFFVLCLSVIALNVIIGGEINVGK